MRVRSIVAGAVASLVLAGCGIGVASPTPLAVEPAAWAPTALEESVWWRTGWRAGDEPQAWETLRVGRADGSPIAEIELGAPASPGLGAPLARGPHGGRILYARPAGAGTNLRLLDTASDADWLLATVPGEFRDATLSPDGSMAYWLVTGSDEFSGVWAVHIDLDRGPFRLLGPGMAGAGPSNVLAAVLGGWGQLELSDDGELLAVVECGRAGCLLRVVDLRRDDVLELPVEPGFASLVGFAERGVVLADQCVVLPRGEMVPAEECGPPGTRYEANILRWNHSLGAELPSGWRLNVVRAPGSAPNDFTMHAVAEPPGRGQPVELDALGTFSGQG
jgi:hypothetical protein